MYLHEVGGSEEIHYPTVQPLSKKLLKKIRQRLHVEWLMDMTLRDMILYGFYVGVVMFMVHGHRNINLVYRNNLAIEDVLVNPGCIKLYQCFFLEKVGEINCNRKKYTLEHVKYYIYSSTHTRGIAVFKRELLLET